jgi:16S rRNA (guanine527-N7)-methyltransferase
VFAPAVVIATLRQQKAVMSDRPDPHSAYSPDDFQKEFNVSRETMNLLLAYEAELLRTTAHTNLIAKSTIDARWDRHFRDSAQLAALVPKDATSLIDLGSGAGFPGLVLAALLSDRLTDITLVESTGKKAAFLRRATAAMGLEGCVTVTTARIESLRAWRGDVVTARALATLTKLLDYAAPFLGPDSVGILPKGQDVENELTQATKSWCMSVERIPSRTQEGAVILIIKDVVRKSA